MKKLYFTVIILISFSFSFGFGSCSEEPSYKLFFDFIRFCTSGHFYAGDSGSDYIFIIAVGNNGKILKSSGSDTMNFSYRQSGTVQNLNVVRVQPSIFQPLVLAAGNSGTILRSTDQGETWLSSAPVTSADLYAADINSGVQFTAGDNGTIMISYSMGANWSLQQTGTNRNLKGIGMNGGLIVAVGEKGTILRTTNSGQNWINVSLADTSVNFYCVSQRTRQNFNAENFYIAGSQGKIYKSTDNGATWALKNSGTSNTLRSIFFSGNDSGAVCGDNGTVRITTNAGETWFSDPYFNNVTGSLSSLYQYPRPGRTFTALSGNNTLVTASDDTSFAVLGITQSGNSIPAEFKLSQNYPNPFNPVTNIEFKIKETGNVKLVIYDINGKVIETLADQKLSSGTYKATWNAVNFSSGIYFYNITAGNISQTKKMVLIK